MYLVEYLPTSACPILFVGAELASTLHIVILSFLLQSHYTKENSQRGLQIQLTPKPQ